MNLSIFAGDLTEAPVEAICTSTNPRLSLFMGTGGAVRERGGFEVLRACEAILKSRGSATLPTGSAHPTTAGELPYKAVIHCVASDKNHYSSVQIIRACVVNALTVARSVDCSTVAMPVFGTGHARFPFEKALSAMVEALRWAADDFKVTIVVTPARAEQARRLLEANLKTPAS